MPSLCDSESGQRCEGLDWVAEYLKPISFFGDLNLLEYFADDEEALDRWESRFLS